MEFRLKPQSWGVQREGRDPVTNELVGDRRLVFQEAHNAVMIGPLSDTEWALFVEFVNDPVGAMERARAREKLVVTNLGPGPGRDGLVDG